MTTAESRPPQSDRLDTDEHHRRGRDGSLHARNREEGSLTGAPTRAQRTVASSLWAAYADALGWISELTDEAGLRRRLRGGELQHPVPWRRRIGGQFGVDIDLPAGMYSDDTQLRLAVSRSIGDDGFDVDTFSRVELPVWLSYALGGGNATKAAAKNLARLNVSWYANTFKGWTETGGNGAVMRIQPHVWASPRSDAPGPWLGDVFADAASTHAHPRALLAAVLHALALGQTLRAGMVPEPGTWRELLAAAEIAPRYLERRPELLEYWMPTYDQHALRAGSQSFADAWRDVTHEVLVQMTVVAAPVKRLAEMGELAAAQVTKGSFTSNFLERLRAAYEPIVEALHLRDPNRRGSGTATALAALAVASALNRTPHLAVLVPCSALGTDTDTIGTMVGALVGAASASPPVDPATGRSHDGSTIWVADASYLAREAHRCAAIANGQSMERLFAYPDLLHWSAPKTQLDAVGLVDGEPALAGLADLTLERNAREDDHNHRWQWWRTDYDQRLLLKSRHTLIELADGQRPIRRTPQPVAVKENLSARRAPARSGEPSAPQQPPLPLEEEGEASLTRAGSTSTPQPSPADAHHQLRDRSFDALIASLDQRSYGNVELGGAIKYLAQTASLEDFLAVAAILRDRIRRRGA